MHQRHYSPVTPLLLVRGGALPTKGLGVYLKHGESMPGNARDYAAALYAKLHQLDQQGYDWIAVEEPPKASPSGPASAIACAERPAGRPMNTAHPPLLANLLGYSAGTLIFGIFLVLLWKDRAGQQLRSSRLTLAAALVALAWNAGALALLFVDSTPLLVVTTSALSLLPALLLDQLLDGRLRWIVRAGDALSLAAMALHASEQWLSGANPHCAQCWQRRSDSPC